MLKKYIEFISENHGGFDSLPEYIEYLSKDNEYALNVISEFTKDIDPTVRIANAVNTLDEHTQKIILKMIEDEKSDVKPEKEIGVTSYTSTRFDESQQTGGKNIFKCFLKVVSALGQKNSQIDWEKTPDDFLAIFVTDSVDLEQTKGIMSRYLYFDNFIKSNKTESTTAHLYFGIKSNLNVEYGIIVDGKSYFLGSFLLTQGTYNFIMTLDLKSATNLKKFLVSMDLSKLNIYSKLKSVMKEFFPGQSESKLKPTINGDVISYGFKGLGSWDNGQLDSGELENIKTNLRSYLMQYKWSDKIQFNVIPSDHWIFINIKLK
jgi:hypothetical protein